MSDEWTLTGTPEAPTISCPELGSYGFHYPIGRETTGRCPQGLPYCRHALPHLHSTAAAQLSHGPALPWPSEPIAPAHREPLLCLLTESLRSPKGWGQSTQLVQENHCCIPDGAFFPLDLRTPDQQNRRPRGQEDTFFWWITRGNRELSHSHCHPLTPGPGSLAMRSSTTQRTLT